MANFYNQRNPVIPTTTITARNSDVILTTNPIVNMVGDRFILELDQSLPFGVTFPTTLDDSANTFNIYDRYGNYVRADRLYSAIEFRKAGLLPYNGCNVRQFQCVLGTDPGRVNILCCLPRSNYVPSTNVTTTSSITDKHPTTESSAETVVEQPPAQSSSSGSETPPSSN